MVKQTGFSPSQRLMRLCGALKKDATKVPTKGFSIPGLDRLCAAFLLAAMLATPVPACTTFLLQGTGALYFGRNLDWFWEDGMVVINPRDMQKSSIVLPGGTPAKWTSRYGSVTFNQFGREMPFGGMNTAGLVVENMWLDETEYAEPDSRP